MKNVHDEKEKLMAQFFGNSRTLDINETMKTLDSIDSELNRLIEKITATSGKCRLLMLTV